MKTIRQGASTVVVALAIGLCVFAVLSRFSVREGQIAQRGQEDVANQNTVLRPEPRSDLEESFDPASRREAVPAVETAMFSGEVGTISGIVLDVQGKPFSGATCELFEGKDRSGTGSFLPDQIVESEAPTFQATSDSEGRFQFVVRSSSWRLRVEAPGLAAPQSEALIPGDFVWVRLQPALQLSLIVQDDLGRPISGANAHLLLGEKDPPSWSLFSATTDDRGETQWKAVPPEPFFLQIRHPEFLSFDRKIFPPRDKFAVVETVVLERGIRIVGSVRVEGGFPPPLGAKISIGTTEGISSYLEIPCDPDGRYATGYRFSNGQILQLTAVAPNFSEMQQELHLEDEIDASGEQRVDFELSRPGRTVRGQLKHQDGLNAQGVAIFVKPFAQIPGGNYFESLAAAPPGNAWRPVGVSGSEGVFEIEGLRAASEYRVLFLDGNSHATVAWVPEGREGEAWDLGILALKRGGRLSGIVKNAGGFPVPRVDVWVTHVFRVDEDLSSYRPNVPGGTSVARTNEAGYFVLDSLAEGKYEIRVDGNEFGDYFVRDGEATGPLDLIVPEGGELAGGRIPISGELIDFERQPVGLIFAQLYTTGDPSAAHPAQLVGQATVGPKGMFQFSALESANYFIRIQDFQGRFLGREFDLGRVETARKVTIPLEKNPSPGLPIRGIVTNADGDPLAGLCVMLQPSPEDLACGCFALKAVTDEVGEFIFEQVMVGKHRVIVRDPGGHYSLKSVFPSQPGDLLTVVLN